MQVVKFEQQPIGELMSMADAFAKSGMFQDTKTAAQAIVKIQAGQEIGIPPFAAMTGIHIIQGKPTLGAGLIASRVKGSGKYDYKVIEQTEKICSIDFYQGKEIIGNSSFTIEEAKRAGTKNLDKYPKNMLFARAISNGVKWYCPDVFSGPVYVPEEMPPVDEMEQSNANEAASFEVVTVAPPDKAEKDMLRKLVNNSDLNDDERVAAFEAIDNCQTYKLYETIQHRLEARQKPLDQIVNPNATDVNRHLKAAVQ